METNADPSDDEIRRYMNFEKLIADARQSSRSKTLRRAWIILPLGIMMLSWFVLDKNFRQDPQDQERLPESRDGTLIDDSDLPSQHDPLTTNNAKQPAQRSTSQNRPDAGTQRDQPDASSLPAQPELLADASRSAHDARSKVSIDILPSGLENKSPGETISPGIAPSESGDNYIQAEPQQGYAQLYTYFRENLAYPKEALRDSIEGIETVSFVIDEQGKPGKIEVTHSLGAAFDQEALRLIRGMPIWKPAMLNGRPVASQLSVPLTFQLKHIRNE